MTDGLIGIVTIICIVIACVSPVKSFTDWANGQATSSLPHESPRSAG